MEGSLFQRRTNHFRRPHHSPSSVALLLIFALLLATAAKAPQEDLYKLLGIARSATTKEIKSAYRQKARDTHPDKNQGVDPEVAAEEFRKVVHAFEVLSDDNSRRRYDRTGQSGGAESTNGGSGDNRGGGGFHEHWWQHFHGRRRRAMKDRPDVKEAQTRVMHVVSIAQLETVMLDDDGLLERNLLLCFVTPMDVERIADEEVVFPYPFAGMSKQGIWWEDILQTVKVRYHRENDLSKHFGMPTGDEMRSGGMPMFAFVRRGDPLTKFETTRVSNHKEFDLWVWKQLEVVVEFRNEHKHPVELYWINENSGKLRSTIQPGKSYIERTMLSHEWFARDARVDKFPSSPGGYKLSKPTSVGTWKIVSDTEQRVIVIPNKSCLDLSGHCEFWIRAGGGRECENNPSFMLEHCALSCKACTENDDDVHDEL